MGDFNINALSENQTLTNVLSNYDQIVTTSTHISGSVLDHVYISRMFSRELDMKNVIDIYFSDHDAVKFRLV